jgi:cytochrome c peroxidase
MDCADPYYEWETRRRMKWRQVLIAALLPAALLFNPDSVLATPEYDYLLHCSGCHLENGAGSPPDVPDLRLSMFWLAGIAEGRSYLVRVPGASQAPVSDAQLSEVINWMLRNYVAQDQTVELYTADEVSRYRKIPLYNPVDLREQLLKNR